MFGQCGKVLRVRGWSNDDFWPIRVWGQYGYCPSCPSNLRHCLVIDQEFPAITVCNCLEAKGV